MLLFGITLFMCLLRGRVVEVSTVFNSVMYVTEITRKKKRGKKKKKANNSLEEKRTA